MSRFFIERPVFATVLAMVLVLAGLVSARFLPVAQYPEIAPPTVTITATYPGASAETLARTVAAPIEEQLSGVERLSFFGAMIEVFQSIPALHRDCDVFDWATDTIAVVIAVALLARLMPARRLAQG